MKSLLLLVALAVGAQAQSVGPISGGTSGASVNGAAIAPTTVAASTVTLSGQLLVNGPTAGGPVGIKVSSKTVIIDGAAPSLKIGDATNAGTLTVSGASGSSTFYGSTLTVAATGIVSAPSQSGAKVYTTQAESIPGSVFVPIPFGGESWDKQNSHSVTVASSTVYARGAGGYYIYCQFDSDTASGADPSQMRAGIFADGSEKARRNYDGITMPANTSFNVTAYEELTDGQAITCQVFHNKAAGINVGAASDAKTNFMIVKKVW